MRKLHLSAFNSIIAPVLGALALAALLTGCSTTQPTENMLSAAGFKIVPASTPEKQSHLKTLPPHKVTMVQRDGKTYFVFPDQKQQVLYVGQQEQYNEYQKLRMQAQLAAEEINAAELNSQAAWGTWGGWGGMSFVAPVPVFRR